MENAPRSYSLGPSRPRWTPTSWNDVVDGAQAGLFDESRWVELKEAVPPRSKPANLELARDLASLAAEGGLLLIGVKDAGGGKAGNVLGTSNLSALRARIDQVAGTRIAPPLVVSSQEIHDPNSSSDDSGCLIVSVPASPEAPHMVDSSYWGRGDTGKRKLDNTEVERYYRDRRLRIERAGSRLRAWVDSPSVRKNTTTAGRIYIAVTPRGGRADQFEHLLYRGDRTVPDAIQAAAYHVGVAGMHGQPISRAIHYYRGNGHEGYTTEDHRRRDTLDEADLVAVQVHDDGTVCTIHGEVTQDDAEHGRLINMNIVRDMVMESLLLATELGNRAGYYGLWDAGVHITRADGASDIGLRLRGGVRGATWNEVTYEQVTTISSEQLASVPQDVAHRLLLPLARVLRVERELASRLGLNAS